jgi:protein CWC15
LFILFCCVGSDEEDDTAELLAELERIKKERAEEKLRKERQQQDQEMKVKESELVRGNPLLNPTSFTVKRRWDDDVVFKNQARGELKTAKRFINDTIRNDFHRKFLNKYMK